MRHLLIYFTQDLCFNELFCDFVNRKLAMKNLKPDFVAKFAKDEAKLEALLQIDAKKHDLITIVADSDSFSSVNKIFATIKECELIAIDDEFIVSDYLKYEKNSLLIDLDKVRVNILKVSDFYIPTILHDERKSCDFYLSDLDLESAKVLLNTTTKPYGIDVGLSSLLENLLYVKVEASEFSDELGFLNSAKSLFSEKIILSSNLYEHILKKLIQNNKKLSLAESCSGGLLASQFTKLNGSSKAYEGSVITYSNKSKKAWLGVNDEYLEGANVYSQNCALAMAQGIMRLTKSNYALSCTGVLGDSDDLGVLSGVVYICALNDDGEYLCERLELKGDRIYKQEQCALACALLLCKLDKKVFFG